MKLNPSALLGLLCILLIGGCAVFGPTKPSAVQVDLGKLLNARVVITQKDGQLQLADYALDRGDTSILITKSAAEVSEAGKLNPLPDSGFFAANNQHPDVQLPYGIVGGGPQVHRSPDQTETYLVPTPSNYYSQMQLFFISAAGPTPISVQLQYADGSSEQRTTVVPDFYFLLKPTDKDWFVLAADFGKVNRKGLMTESVHHFIDGFSLNPNPSKRLRGIEITKLDSKSVLNLFGATGTLKTH
ncbi:MAG TPA: hypothetical protein VK811_06105 [Candidatus Acidoferrum sp.]|jgi:hypothetical protein|nr:hypothetical protein [Candidatus Acidoferrum sp.]